MRAVSNCLFARPRQTEQILSPKTAGIPIRVGLFGLQRSAAPEIVLGASLLGLFVTINLARGFITLLLSHVAFSIAYVTVTVRARLTELAQKRAHPLAR